MKSVYTEADSYLLKSDAYLSDLSRDFRTQTHIFIFLCLEAHKTSPFNVIIRLKYHLEMKTILSTELVSSPGIVAFTFKI